jgi:hypothetical protein
MAGFVGVAATAGGFGFALACCGGFFTGDAELRPCTGDFAGRDLWACDMDGWGLGPGAGASDAGAFGAT